MAYVAAAAVFAVVVSLTASLFAGGEACNNVASRTKAALCQQTGSRWQKPCQQALQSSPDAAELTVYALAATTLAKRRYDDTLAALDPLLGGGNLPGDERLAIDDCKQKYGVARSRLASVVDQLSSCDFSLARQEHVDAVIAVRSCQEALQPYQFLPVFDQVSADHDATMVANLLGATLASY